MNQLRNKKQLREEMSDEGTIVEKIKKDERNITIRNYNIFFRLFTTLQYSATVLLIYLLRFIPSTFVRRGHFLVQRPVEG